MEDESSRSSGAMPRPMVIGSRGSTESSHGPTAMPRSSHAHSAGGGSKVSSSHGSGATRGAATPTSAASQDVDVTFSGAPRTPRSYALC